MDVVIKNLGTLHDRKGQEIFTTQDMLLPQFRFSGVWEQPVPFIPETKEILETMIREKFPVFLRDLPKPIAPWEEPSGDPLECGITVPIPRALLGDMEFDLTVEVLPEIIESLEYTIAKKRDGVNLGGIFD